MAFYSLESDLLKQRLLLSRERQLIDRLDHNLSPYQSGPTAGIIWKAGREKSVINLYWAKAMMMR